MEWFREGKWVTGGFIVTLIVTGAMSFTSYQNSVQLVNSASQLQQTNEILDVLNDIESLLAEAESRLWSYIVFNDPAELTQYRLIVMQLNRALERIRSPLADTQIQQQRLLNLEVLIQERFQLFEQAIAKQPVQITPVDPFISQTQVNLGQIRQTVAELEEKEEEIIAIRLEAVSTDSRARMLIEPVGAVVTFSIVLGIFGLLYRQLRQRQQAEALQQTLRQEKKLSELKLQLFSMVSHEFRTPLSLIMGSSQLLEEGLRDHIEPARLKSLYRIQSSAKTMTQLLNDILMVARADAGALEFNPKWTEIQTFCLNLIEDFQVAHLSQQSIVFTHQGDRTHAFIDERLLYSILSNLLSNAVKFSPAHCPIRFSVFSHVHAITFEVRDEGIGIPEEEQSRLYDPFIRGSNVENTRGTGLGLAVVQRCVALHGGAIALSSHVNVGTTFTVTIPQPES